MDPKLIDAARTSFPDAADSIVLGALLDGRQAHPEPLVRVPLSILNRHGLVAGATGTGKTKTLQLMAEQLSRSGVPVFLADLKGDLAGIAAPGEASERVTARARETGFDWQARACPVEFFSLTGGLGAQIRATVSSFGPLLLAKVLDLNQTQTSVLSLVFKYCDDRGLELLDFADLRTVLQHLSGAGAGELAALGGMSKATVGVLLREMVELEQQGALAFFGEPELDLDDLLRVVPDGRGVVSILALEDVQDKPALFSTFMMWLLAQLFAELPELGDPPKPRLVFFFDEAHLLFRNASPAFLDQVGQVVRLIRSKGVGIFFVTQNPKDVPAGDTRTARYARAARTSRVHAGRRQGPARGRADVSEDRVLRHRGDAHDARHRRGADQRARCERCTHAAVRDPVDSARIANGPALRRGAARAVRDAPGEEVPAGDRSRECAREAEPARSFPGRRELGVPRREAGGGDFPVRDPQLSTRAHRRERAHARLARRASRYTSAQAALLVTR